MSLSRPGVLQCACDSLAQSPQVAVSDACGGAGKTKGTRQLLVGRKSYATDYTLSSNQYGSVECQMAVVCTYYKGFKGKHGIQYCLYVMHRIKLALHQLHQHYKARFGIETSYRIKNTCRIRTTSKNPVTRLLFVALALILVNLWVYLLWFFVSRTQRGGQVVYRELSASKRCWSSSHKQLNGISPLPLPFFCSLNHEFAIY